MGFVVYFPVQSLESTVNDSTERDNQAKLIQTYCFTAADLYNPDQKMTEMDMQWEEEKDRKERANSQGRTTNDDFFFFYWISSEKLHPLVTTHT